jgi:hypothetical protein
MAQIQTRIKDSTLRLILPAKDRNYQIRTPRQNSRAPRCIKINELDEEHSPVKPFKPFLAEIAKLKAPDSAEIDESPLRKRGYSDVDQINFKELKLNIKASLQKVCDKKIKVSDKKL